MLLGEIQSSAVKATRVPRCLRTQRRAAGRSHGLYRNWIVVMRRKSREIVLSCVALSPSRSCLKVEEEKKPPTSGPGRQ
jgi:hypothetical protein